MLPGIGRRTAKVLRMMQVRTIGQFKAIPEAVLVELFGPSIRTNYHAVQGMHPHKRFVTRSAKFTVRANWLGRLKFAQA